MDETIHIYAELSKRQYGMLDEGDAELEVPYGVTMAHRAGNRALLFACDDRDCAQELMDGLDASSINWQEE